MRGQNHYPSNTGNCARRVVIATINRLNLNLVENSADAVQKIGSRIFLVKSLSYLSAHASHMKIG